jgi:hypothetical protein
MANEADGWNGGVVARHSVACSCFGVPSKLTETLALTRGMSGPKVRRKCQRSYRSAVIDTSNFPALSAMLESLRPMKRSPPSCATNVFSLPIS